MFFLDGCSLSSQLAPDAAKHAARKDTTVCVLILISRYMPGSWVAKTRSEMLIKLAKVYASNIVEAKILMRSKMG